MARTTNTTRPSNGQLLKQVSWHLAYVFYILMAIALIIVSAITLRYGDAFFGATNPLNGGTNGQNNGNNENSEDGQAVNPQAPRLLEQARSNVMSSIGVALGVLALVFNSTSLSIQLYLDHRWLTIVNTHEYNKRVIWVWLARIINGIFFCATIALTVGFALASKELQQAVSKTSSATPGYLISAAVLAALTAVGAACVIVADTFKLRKYTTTHDELFDGGSIRNHEKPEDVPTTA